MPQGCKQAGSHFSVLFNNATLYEVGREACCFLTCITSIKGETDRKEQSEPAEYQVAETDCSRLTTLKRSDE
jgi:hypothetical protein